MGTQPCRDAPADVQTGGLTTLLELGARDRAAIASRYTVKIDVILPFLSHTNTALRTLAARLLGLVTTGSTPVATVQLLTQLAAKLPGSTASEEGTKLAVRYEEKHGCTTAAGFVGAAAMLAAPIGSGGADVRKAVQQCVSQLVPMLGSGDAPLAVAAAVALGHLQLAAPLPIETGNVDTEPSQAGPQSAAGVCELPTDELIYHSLFGIILLSACSQRALRSLGMSAGILRCTFARRNIASTV